MSLIAISALTLALALVGQAVCPADERSGP